MIKATTACRSVLLAGLLLAAGAAAAADQGKPDPELRFNQGIQHLKEGRVDMAVEALKSAVKEDPKNPYFQRGLGQAYAAKREWDKAIESYRRALELNEYYVDVRNDLGVALLLSGRREEGRKELLAAFADPLCPAPEMTARNLGQAYFEEKNYGEAYNWFRTATQRNPKYVDAYLGLADTLTALGRLDEAIATLELGDKQVADSPALLLSLGEACFQAGRFTEARGYLERVARLDPAGPRGRGALEKLRQFPH